MGVWQRFLANVRLRRFAVLLSVIVVLYLLRGLLSMILLTFIFTFLVFNFAMFLKKQLRLPFHLGVILIYLALIGLLYLAVTIYFPLIFKQTEAMIRYLVDFYQKPSMTANKVFDFFSQYISTSTLSTQLKNGVAIVFKYVTSIGTVGATFIFSLILSFFFTIEERRMANFSQNFLSGPFAWYFQDIYFFAKKFVNTFGIVIETQFIIAIVNTIITTICLAFLKMPQLFSLSLLIFIMSLIPVAGVIISAIPMSVIGYSVGGLRDVIYIIIMLLVVHALESYVLNPKLMSNKTELPIFYTFVVLFVAEKLFGMWGLIVGIPIFTFLLDILGVKAIKQTGKQDKIEKKEKSS
ncbi:AI-2E family transporter [Liquorilactobacillus vini]|uniref:AI-2E family transporter n=1 Tax=Liquorilactobacillus vini TaxID=238015 RepID=UPI00030898E0|nr:AI-2E family transporter [Liquorilactobacillus vini]